MVSFHKEKDDKIQGYLFLFMRIIPGGFPGRRECQKLTSFNMQQVTFSLYSADKLILKTDISAIFQLSVNVVH